MTKKLEDLLGLPGADENAPREAVRIIPAGIKDKVTLREQTHIDNLFRDPAEYQKIVKALPQVTGLGDASDKEFDALAQRATDAYDDLMDLGMNVDPRYSARIFEVASSMLKNAIDAKNAKLEKKLKMIDLQLKKAQLDQKEASKEKEIEATPLGEGRELDRNELLKMLAAKSD